MRSAAEAFERATCQAFSSTSDKQLLQIASTIAFLEAKKR